jgi:hypothetical protein
MDRRKFLGALNAGGFAAFCRVGLPLGALAAAAPSQAAIPATAKPRIKVSSESYRGHMLYDHSYEEVPGEDSRTRPNLLLRDSIQWTIVDAQQWQTSAPDLETAFRRLRTTAAYQRSSRFIQPILNQRVDAFVEGADVFIALIWHGQPRTEREQYLAAVAHAIRKHGSLGIAVVRRPYLFESIGYDWLRCPDSGDIRSTFDIVVDVAIGKFLAPSRKISIDATYAAIGAWEKYCIATLCAELAGYDAMPIDSLRNRLCNPRNGFAGA